ncbi:MAG TPA: hypothetical protein PKE03_08705 [Bacteroidales bacterium]|nr:hypothetical protein [Bacteroidales bacterium]
MGQTIEQVLHFEAIGLINTLFEAADGDFTCRRAHQYLNKVDTYNFHPSLDYFGGCEYLSTAADLATFYY